MGEQTGAAGNLDPRGRQQIPTDPRAIAKSFGFGWWKPNPQAAAELLEKAGFSKKGDAWFTPDGKPFSIKIMVEGESRPVMTRAGTMIAQQWRAFDHQNLQDIYAVRVRPRDEIMRMRAEQCNRSGTVSS